MDTTYIRELIINNEFDQAIAALKNHAPNQAFGDELDGLNGRWTSLNQTTNQGVLDHSEFRKVQNEIRTQLLALCTTFANSHHQDNSSDRVIIGLLSYTREDAEIFKHLQRKQEIELYAKAVLDADFHLGVLSGPSGCGKSSFLQAGLQPILEQKGAEVFYIKFSNKPPIEAISAVLKKSAQLTTSELAGMFKELSNNVSQDPIILIFDQFEQFFANYRSEEDRQPFIAELKEWYDKRQDFSVKVLVAVRSDMHHFLYEIQEALHYDSTALKNYFNLKKFNPAQAAEIFKFIAECQEIEFEEQFVKQMCSEELADKEDGLISAVEIQILAMMLEGQNTSEQFAFTRKAYERFGGIEGLLQRYLAEQLNTKNIYNKNQGAMKILLGLTDLNRNVRAGQLTSSEIQTKLKGVVDKEKIGRILQWLEKGRLIRKIEIEDASPAYELAHERMIIPLRNLAGKTLTEIDQVSQLLDRRVNEWLGNTKKTRYLFTPIEIWKIRKYRDLIAWEPKYEQKKALYKQSIYKWRNRSIAFFSLILPILLFYFYLGSEAGIEKLIQYWLFPQSLQVAYADTKAKTAGILAKSHPKLALMAARKIERPYERCMAFLRMGDSLLVDSTDHIELINDLYQEGFEYKDSISSTYNRADALVSLALAAGEMAKTTKDASYFSQGEKIANTIESADSRADALESLARAAGEMAKTTKDASSLAQGEKIANTIEDVYSRASALRSLAIVAGEMAKTTKDVSYLSQGEKIANTIESADSRASAFGRLAIAAGEMGQTQEAKGYLSQGEKIANTIESADSRADAFESLAGAAGEIAKTTKDASYLSQGEKIAKTIEDAVSRANTLLILAIAAGEMGQTQEAKGYLSQGEKIANTIESASSRAHALLSLAIAAGEIAKTTKDASYLSHGEKIANTIESASSRADALRSLARVAGQIAKTTKDVSYLSQGEKIADTIESADSRAEALRSLAIVAGEMAKTTKDASYLSQGEKIANTIEDADSRASALLSLALAAGEMGQTQEAKGYLSQGEKIANTIESAYSRADAFESLAGAAGEIAKTTKDASYLSHGEKIANKIEYSGFRANALESLAIAAGEMAKTTKDESYLSHGEKIANTIEDADSHADALLSLAIAAGEIEQRTKAFSLVKLINTNERSIGYAWILRMRKKQKSKPDMKEQFLKDMD